MKNLNPLLLLFFPVIFSNCSWNLTASDGDSKSNADKAHEFNAGTISIDTTKNTGTLSNVSSHLILPTQSEYHAQYAPYIKLKEFYSKLLQSSDPDLKRTDFVFVTYTLKPPKTLLESLNNHIPTRVIQDIVYGYVDSLELEKELELPRVVPLATFWQDATYDDSGTQITPEIRQKDGALVRVATEKQIIPLTINQQHPKYGNLYATLMFLLNKPYLNSHFKSADFYSVAKQLRDMEEINLFHPGYTSRNDYEPLWEIPYYQPLVCAGDYSASDDAEYIKAILDTNIALTAEQRQTLQEKYDNLKK